jgi:hypothetical protein
VVDVSFKTCAETNSESGSTNFFIEFPSVPSFAGSFLSAPFAAVDTWYTETFFLEHLPSDMTMTASTTDGLCIEDIITNGYPLEGFDRIYLDSPCDVGGSLCYETYSWATLDWTVPTSQPSISTSPTVSPSISLSPVTSAPTSFVKTDPSHKWNFSEGVGLVAHDEHDSADCTLSSADLWTGLGSDGALSFDGASSSLNCGYDSALIGSISFEISLMVSTTQQSSTYLVSQRDGGSIHGEWVLEMGSDGLLRFWAYSQTGADGYCWNLYSSRAINDEEWHLVVARRTAADVIEIWIDHSLDASVAPTKDMVSCPMSRLQVYVGKDGRTNSAFLDGLMDEVSLSVIISSTVVHGWSFDEGAGLVAHDENGAADCTLSSADMWADLSSAGRGLPCSSVGVLG